MTNNNTKENEMKIKDKNGIELKKGMTVQHAGSLGCDYATKYIVNGFMWNMVEVLWASNGSLPARQGDRLHASSSLEVSL